MKKAKANIFDLPEKLPSEELVAALFNNGKVLIERIISTGQVTPPGDWCTTKSKMNG